MTRQNKKTSHLYRFVFIQQCLVSAYIFNLYKNPFFFSGISKNALCILCFINEAICVSLKIPLLQ